MLKVVIVEDDRMVAAINNQFAEKTRGIQVVATFHNGKDALAFLEKSEVDVLLLDLYMPDLTGLELLEVLREKGKEMDVIMITAANDKRHLQQAINLGVTDYLVKPFRYERFAQALDKVILRRKVIESGMEYTQDDIDQILLSSQPKNVSKQLELEKGLQRQTLERIRLCLKDKKKQKLTAEQVSGETGFSKITIRRYLNYLIETGEVDSTVDYSTGGRPCVLYQYQK